MSQDALTFYDLQVHVAQQLGVAEYGAAGDEIAQPPSDIYTLNEVKGYINGGIRMLLNDAPASGWRWQQPTASLILWPTTTTGVVTVSGTADTILTSASAAFYPSMVGHAIMSDTLGNSYTIASYTSSTVVVVTADASADDGDTFTITADGDYTLPSTFGGEYLGPIHYAANSSLTHTLGWLNEGRIRRFRENTSGSTGYPTMAAVRKMADLIYWELVVYPTPSAVCTVEFPYELYFTALSDDTDVHPAGQHYDEVVLAACKAYAEMEGEDAMAGKAQYYQQKALPGAMRRNLRAAPKRIGNLLDIQSDHPVPHDHEHCTLTIDITE